MSKKRERRRVPRSGTDRRSEKREMISSVLTRGEGRRRGLLRGKKGAIPFSWPAEPREMGTRRPSRCDARGGVGGGGGGHKKLLAGEGESGGTRGKKRKGHLARWLFLERSSFLHSQKGNLLAVRSSSRFKKRKTDSLPRKNPAVILPSAAEKVAGSRRGRERMSTRG